MVRDKHTVQIYAVFLTWGYIKKLWTKKNFLQGISQLIDGCILRCMNPMCDSSEMNPHNLASDSL